MNRYVTSSRPVKCLVMIAGIMCSHVYYVQAEEGHLNSVQAEYLEHLIHSQLNNQADRDYVNSRWTEAQRVAEFICRPLAQKEITRQHPGADKVILDQGKKDTQHLLSARFLIGNGEYRTGNTWTSFLFKCEISTQTGKAEKFQILDKPVVRGMMPGPVIH
ncbi:hypothetical protein DRW78_16050, partial [Salmonella enterica subsp. salamae]|nr:hypothetical protein [Salmonella enterica subsp. salamae]